MAYGRMLNEKRKKCWQFRVRCDVFKIILYALVNVNLFGLKFLCYQTNVSYVFNSTSDWSTSKPKHIEAKTGSGTTCPETFGAPFGLFQ